MIPVEMLSMAIGGASGFIFKMIAQAQADKNALFERLIKSHQESDNSADKAAARDGSRAGQYTRRLIVLIVLFSAFIVPFLTGLLDIPAIVQTVTVERSWLGGLIQTGGKTQFYQIDGYLISPTLLSCALAIVSFYFGRSAADRN